MQSYAPMGWNPSITAAMSPWTAGGAAANFAPVQGAVTLPGGAVGVRVPDIQAMGMLPALQGTLRWPGIVASIMPQ